MSKAKSAQNEPTGDKPSGDESQPNQQPQPGDILLFKRARKWNRLITWFTRSPYYHVAIYEGRDHVVEARPRGVVRRDLNGPDGDKSFEVIPAPEGRGAEALRWAEQQVGKRYGKRDVAVLIAGRVANEPRPRYNTRDKFSCGELVTCAFQNAGVPLFPGHDLRSGYLRANPRDPVAVERILFEASHLVGTFDKPRYIAFTAGLCAHSRSNITGCTRCLEVCPAGAIREIR